jgi:23S rRNA (uridine2552-2'-O)-methyltransferase
VSSKPYKPKDHFFKKAHAEGLRARSAFKIEEIARRFSIFRKGQAVLDLGAAPGGFLQIILGEVGPSGVVVGIDLVAIRSFGKPNVKTAVLDVLAEDFDARLLELHAGVFDVVASDLAPKTTGVHTVDEARSLRLAGKALEVSQKRGKPGGHFIAKLFMGGEFEEFRDAVRGVYDEVKVVRPEATRGGSKEVYLVGLRRRAV